MTTQADYSPIFIQLERLEVKLGQALAKAAELRGKAAELVGSTPQTINEINQLIVNLEELQFGFKDWQILLEDNQPLKEEITQKSQEELKERIIKIVQYLEANLPQREKPIIRKGHELALVLFEAEIEAKMLATLAEQLGVFPLKELAEASRQLLFLLGRWSNTFTLQKEFLWVEPKKETNQSLEPSFREK